MGQLNNIGLLWHFGDSISLEQHIKAALNSWNRHKDTRDIVPDDIVFCTLQPLSEELITMITKSFSLTVKYRATIHKNHFQIEGKLY